MNCRLDVELHPLQNVEILSTIFSFCSVKDLKQCRLVGLKLWLKASMHAWKEKAVLKILPEPDSDCSHGDVPGIGFNELRTIYGDENNSLELHKKPFKNIKLEGFFDYHFGHLELEWILDKFSDHIRHLGFKSYEFESMTRIMETILVRLPNLVELKLEKDIRINSDSGASFIEQRRLLAGQHQQYSSHQNLKCVIVATEQCEDDSFSFWFPFLLRNIANLQDLRVISDKWASYTDYGGRDVMCSVAWIRRENPRLCQLKYLDNIHCPLTGNGFTRPELFQFGASFPLERFTGRMVDVMHLRPYTGTLKYLNVIFNGKENNSEEESSSDTEDDKIPFPHVKEFHAHGPVLEMFHNLNKVEAFNLETLVVGPDFKCPYPRDIPKSCQVVNIELRNSSFRNVTKLECYNESQLYVIDLEDFTFLSESMPNVLHAKMPLTRKAFEKLCSTWTNLLTLTISRCLAKYKLIDDEAITGIRPSNANVPAEGDRKRPPNITNLKRLTDFVSFSPLTDHSVNFGFLHLPRLHYLDVKFREISEEAESALRKKVNALTLQ